MVSFQRKGVFWMEWAMAGGEDVYDHCYCGVSLCGVGIFFGGGMSEASGVDRMGLYKYIYRYLGNLPSHCY